MSKEERWELVGTLCSAVGAWILAFGMAYSVYIQQKNLKVLKATPPTAVVEVTSEGRTDGK